MITPEILALMNRTGELITDKMVDTLISNGSIATGGLARGIGYTTIETKDGIKILITIPGYGDFVDKGVIGTKSGVSLAGYKFKSKAISPLSKLPLPVRIAIAQRGISPKPFIENSIQFVLQNFTQELTEAGAVDINNIIVSEFRKIPGITVTES